MDEQIQSDQSSIATGHQLRTANNSHLPPAERCVSGAWPCWPYDVRLTGFTLLTYETRVGHKPDGIGLCMVIGVCISNIRA